MDWTLMTQEAFAPKIDVIRNGPVVLDSDLALPYGVTTGNFNKAISRNKHRFPLDFSFVLTQREFADLISKLEHQNVEAGDASCRAFLRSTAPSWPPKRRIGFHTEKMMISVHDAYRCF